MYQPTYVLHCASSIQLSSFQTRFARAIQKKGWPLSLLFLCIAQKKIVIFAHSLHCHLLQLALSSASFVIKNKSKINLLLATATPFISPLLHASIQAGLPPSPQISQSHTYMYVSLYGLGPKNKTKNLFFFFFIFPLELYGYIGQLSPPIIYIYIYIYFPRVGQWWASCPLLYMQCMLCTNCIAMG